MEREKEQEKKKNTRDKHEKRRDDVLNRPELNLPSQAHRALNSKDAGGETQKKKEKIN